MTWTAPTVQPTGQLISAAIYNTDIVDNLIFLKGVGATILGAGSADAGTSSTSPQTFAATGAAACAITLTLPVAASVAPVEIGLDCHFTNGAGGATSPAGYIDFYDSLSAARVDGKVWQLRPVATANVFEGHSIVFRTTSLAAGAHTISPRIWSASAGWSVYVSDNSAIMHYTFWVAQVPS